MIRLGIISTARINTLGILNPCQKRDDIKVTAIASKNPNKAQQIAQKYNIDNIFSSYNDLLESKDIDAVYISLPNNSHFDFAKQALKAGKHVLCEKPIVLKVRELIILKNIAYRKKIFLMDALHYLYYEPLIKIMKKLPEYLNTQKPLKNSITKVEAFIGFPYPKNNNDIRLSPYLDGGATAHLGCYITHFMTWLFPKSHWHLYSAHKLHSESHVDIESNYIFKMQNHDNLECSFKVNMNHKKIDSWVTIYTHQQCVTINNVFTPTSFYNATNPGKNLLSLIINDREILDAVMPNDNKTTYDYQLAIFVEGIKNNRPPQVCMPSYEILEKAHAIGTFKVQK
jgi:predicted dehydrogenase